MVRKSTIIIKSVSNFLARYQDLKNSRRFQHNSGTCSVIGVHNVVLGTNEKDPDIPKHKDQTKQEQDQNKKVFLNREKI